ncbi:MAG TPA: 50S ribosomal protein L2 [Candidatus Pacearchaeota archaeon]|jgi:large subunit ribosomal protein L2|nr:50S ribosomal protein L2 [Candidatus Pacearchaeota archaeon]|tara:strand:- start:480 stop:1208 length:729 start_codon:yes stop_codon:yes gene_type:complete
MAKRITQQARGKGSMTFRVRPRAYRHKISYPGLRVEGVGKIIKLFNSSGHTSPLAEIEIKINEKEKARFIVPAAEGVYEGQEIYLGIRPENANPLSGDILMLKDISIGTKIFNIESVPGMGGKLLRAGGSSAVIAGNENGKTEILIRRRRIKLNENCRAVIGVVSGDGRKIKPLVKAGKSHYINKSKGRKWHRTSAVKVNAIDHPFGGGRGKRIKSKIAKRNAPPGRKVGHIRPKQTGRKKR